MNTSTVSWEWYGEKHESIVDQVAIRQLLTWCDHKRTEEKGRHHNDENFSKIKRTIKQSSRMRCRQRSSKRRMSKQVRINGLQFEGNVKITGVTRAGVKLLSFSKCFRGVGEREVGVGIERLRFSWTAKFCELNTVRSLVKLSFVTRMNAFTKLPPSFFPSVCDLLAVFPTSSFF